MRYIVGFRDKTVRAPALDRNPGWVPVIDNQSPFAYGSIVCLCDTRGIAERIARLLNVCGIDPPEDR